MSLRLGGGAREAGWLVSSRSSAVEGADLDEDDDDAPRLVRRVIFCSAAEG
jgi:hypothetical protein